MKQKLTNNLGYKIVSVVLATLLWLIVLNINDPEKTATITNIPIKIINEDAITGQDKVYQVISGKTATVKVTGPRTIIDSLEASSFTATADMSKLSLTNAVGVEVELNSAAYRTKVELDSKTTMVVALEDLVEREFTVDIQQKGTEPTGYIVYDTVIHTDKVKVKAPESVMNNIAKVVAPINVSKATKDFSVTSIFEACDSAGNALNVNKKNITFDVSESRVDVIIYAVKQVPLKYEILEENYANTIFVSKTISKNSITLAGRKETLENVNEIVLDTSNLVVNENESIYNLTYDVSELIPSETYLYGDTKTIVITVETDAIVRKTFTVPVADIAIKSPAEGFTAYIETTGQLRYTLRGRKSILDVYEPDTHMFVSAKGLTEGVYEVELQMELIEGVEQVNKVYVTVKVQPTEIDTDEPDTSETPSQDESDTSSSEQQETTSDQETTEGE